MNRENNLKNFSVRIENLEIRKASYLLPPDKVPKFPAYHIDKWQPNPYYQHESDYEWSEDGESAYGKIDGETNRSFRINKGCFKNPETCYAVASFEYDEHEDFYELHSVGDRLLDLDEHEREIFWELYKIGNTGLNNQSRTVY